MLKPTSNFKANFKKIRNYENNVGKKKVWEIQFIVNEWRSKALS